MSAPPLLAFAGALPVLRAVSIAAAGLLVLAIAKIGRAVAGRVSTDRYVRGARVEVPAARRQRLTRSRRALQALPPCGPLRLGGIRIRAADETKHFKFVGTTGTGKSTAITALLRSALARGDRSVIADPNGASLMRFFDRYRGDVLLNPFDRGSVQWDLFGEIRSVFDAENLARSLVPDCEDAVGREWRSYARTLVSVLVRRSAESGARDLMEFWRLLATADTGEVRRSVAGTAAQPFLDPDNARMFSSVRSVAVSALAALPHIAAGRGRPFSIREWMVRGRGVLYMPYRAEQIAALRTLISTWMRLAIFETLSGAEAAEPRGWEGSAGSADRHELWSRSRCAPHVPRRIWFFIDELDALGPIDGLTDALARLRKFGGCCVLGLQSLAQVVGTYGTAGARSIVENCGNTLILRCSASEGGGTAAFASQLIGEREVLRRNTVHSHDRGALFDRQRGRRSMQVARQRVTEAAVLPSQIEQLPDLIGYFKTASGPCWNLIRLRPEVPPWPSTTSG
ncbi:MAG: type IV secretion system DNA-binding domain-containing protein [Steroidobacteraceae bacterium]